MYKCTHFDIEELVAPEILSVLGHTFAWRMIPEYALRSLDALREKLNAPIYINNASMGFDYSGVRPKGCKVGAKYSGHKGYRGEVCWDLKTFHHDTLMALLEVIESDNDLYNISKIEEPEKTTPRGWIHTTMVENPPQGLTYI